MTKYAYVKDGEVIREVRKLPVKDARATELKERGLLPIDDNKPSTKEWERVGGRTEEVLATKVNYNYEVSEIPLNQFKKMKGKQLIKNAKSVLEARLDSIEQMPSVYKALPKKRTDEMDADAAKVIQEVGQKRNEIKQAKTHQEVADVYLTIVAFVDPSRLDENGHIIPEPMNEV